jgi:hypothetical protein
MAHFKREHVSILSIKAPPPQRNIHYTSAKGRGSILDGYNKKINELFLKGTTSKDILAHIQESGYTGCESLFRMHLPKLNKSRITSKNGNKITTSQKLIKREKMFKLFWRNYAVLTEKNRYY